MSNGASDWINKTLKWSKDIDRAGKLPEVRGPQGVSGPPSSSLPGIPSTTPPGWSNEEKEAWLEAIKAGSQKYMSGGGRFFDPQGRLIPKETWGETLGEKYGFPFSTKIDPKRGISPRIQNLYGEQGQYLPGAFNPADYTQEDFLRILDISESGGPHADIAGASLEHLESRTKEVKRTEGQEYINRVLSEHEMFDRAGIAVTQEQSDELDLVKDMLKLIEDEPGASLLENQPGAISYYGGSLIDLETMDFTATPTTPAEIMTVGGLANDFLISNDIQIPTEENPYFTKQDANGVWKQLVGAEYSQALDAYQKYSASVDLGLETGKKTMSEQLGHDKAIQLETHKNKLQKERDAITNQINSRHKDLDRAILAGNLEESIRANRESESLTRQRNLMDKQQFAMTMIFQIASNPSILFFLRKSGMMNQLATLAGINPSVFTTADYGQENPLGAFNLQAWGQLSPQQQRIAMYSMQAQTGLSEAEIRQKMQATSPGSYNQMIRRTLD